MSPTISQTLILSGYCHTSGSSIAYDDAMIAPEQPYCCPEYISLTYQLESAYVLIVYPIVLSKYPNICLIFKF